MTLEKVIIFGRSPFINEIKEFIPELQENYFNIGINSFPVTFPNVDLWSFIDEKTLLNIIIHNYKGQKILSDSSFQDDLELYDINNYELFETIEHHEPILDIPNCLAYQNITLTIVLNWCIKQGIKEVYLIGHDISPDWSYFDSEASQNAEEKFLKEIRHFIYKCQDYTKIFQCNPNSDLELPKKNIRKLLCTLN
jgi:hypothetical protein